MGAWEWWRMGPVWVGIGMVVRGVRRMGVRVWGNVGGVVNVCVGLRGLLGGELVNRNTAEVVVQARLHSNIKKYVVHVRQIG